jgi:hypothetical protein
MQRIKGLKRTFFVSLEDEPRDEAQPPNELALHLTTSNHAEIHAEIVKKAGEIDEESKHR